MSSKLSRRTWIRQCATGGVFSLLAGSGSAGSGSGFEGADGFRNYFGDLHNHNHVGYARGSLRRSYEIARNHLDFYAFTPHAYWPDIGQYDGNIESKWLNGFHVAQARWPEVVALAREFSTPGKFVTILGYERHSAAEGDYHILYPDLKGDYELVEDLRELQAFARRRGCLLIPHHPANRLGHRGVDSRLLDSSVSPVLEIFSEWGCAEHDRAPQPYKRHTEGGRWTRHTWHYYLEEGHRLGAVASTDDHLGYPGAYREGLAVIKAKELSRDSIFEALRARRCYAVSGDRIGLDFALNGSLMGREVAFAGKRRLEVGVQGWDVLDRVEVVKNGRVIHRDFPVDRRQGPASWDNPVVLRFEYGWGPWPALGWGGTADWEFSIQIEGGRILEVQPCFVTGPLDERRRDRIVKLTEDSVEIQSYTALKQQVDDFSQKEIALRIAGTPSTRITVRCSRPAKCSISQSLGQLAESNEMLFTRPFPWESAMLHRVVFNENSEAVFTVEDEADGSRADWYYVRAVQSNEQYAWSSPIWVEGRGGV